MEIACVDDAGSGDRTGGRIALARCSRPEDNLQILTLQANRDESAPTIWELLTLLKAEGVDVEVERLFLVANKQSRVRDLTEHLPNLHAVDVIIRVSGGHASSGRCRCVQFVMTFVSGPSTLAC